MSELDRLIDFLHQRANDGTLTATEEANAIAFYKDDQSATARIAKALIPDNSVLQPGFTTEITDIGDV